MPNYEVNVRSDIKSKTTNDTLKWCTHTNVRNNVSVGDGVNTLKWCNRTTVKNNCTLASGFIYRRPQKNRTGVGQRITYKIAGNSNTRRVTSFGHRGLAIARYSATNHTRRELGRFDQITQSYVPIDGDTYYIDSEVSSTVPDTCTPVLNSMYMIVSIAPEDLPAGLTWDRPTTFYHNAQAVSLNVMGHVYQFSPQETIINESGGIDTNNDGVYDTWSDGWDTQGAGKKTVTQSLLYMRYDLPTPKEFSEEFNFDAWARYDERGFTHFSTDPNRVTIVKKSFTIEFYEGRPNLGLIQCFQKYNNNQVLFCDCFSDTVYSGLLSVDSISTDSNTTTVKFTITKTGV